MINGMYNRKRRTATMRHIFPFLDKMDDDQLVAMGFDPTAVRVQMDGGDGGDASGGAGDGGDASGGAGDGGTDPAPAPRPDATTGRSPEYTVAGFSLMAKKGIKRFYNQLAKFDAFSTTYAEDFLQPGSPNVRAHLNIPVYDSTGEAEVDNYASWDDRHTGAQTSVQVELQKVDDVIELYGKDFEEGVNIDPLIEGLLSRVANKAWSLVLGKAAIGEAQGDDPDKVVTSIDLGQSQKFDFQYANQTLTESIQPRVNAMLLSSAEYGMLKKTSTESLAMDSIDCDMVAKVQGLSALGEDVYGLLVNKRGLAVGMQAPYLVPGAYGSVERVVFEGSPLPITLLSYFIPGKNCIKIVACTYVGAVVTDVTAVKPLRTYQAS